MPSNPIDEFNASETSLYWDSPEAVKAYTLEPFFYPGEKYAFNLHYPNGLHSLKILDIGCGSGRSTRMLHGMGADLVGVDISRHLIEVARALAPTIEYHVADAQSLPFPDSVFDAVLFSFNGLDYVYPKANRDRAVTEVRRVLKSGGRFIVSHHNSAALIFGLRDILTPGLVAFRLKQIAVGNAFRAECYVHDTGHPEVLTYYCWPGKMIADMKRSGFDLRSIHPNSPKAAAVDRIISNHFFSRLTELWLYYVFQKAATL
ncbi:MAG: class I SAM-dependent methyltransferase [Bauldia sp.]|nr:class I SAM-dependent methyltransferase [Bauldia sp.]